LHQSSEPNAPATGTIVSVVFLPCVEIANYKVKSSAINDGAASKVCQVVGTVSVQSLLIGLLQVVDSTDVDVGEIAVSNHITFDKKNSNRVKCFFFRRERTER
jgi:hypothetical protein